MVPEPPKSFEESNHLFFLLYSLFCFSKILRIFAQVLAELPQTEAVINVLINLVPFISELIGMLVVIFLVFG